MIRFLLFQIAVCVVCRFFPVYCWRNSSFSLWHFGVIQLSFCWNLSYLKTKYQIQTYTTHSFGVSSVNILNSIFHLFNLAFNWCNAYYISLQMLSLFVLLVSGTGFNCTLYILSFTIFLLVLSICPFFNVLHFCSL